MKHINDNAIDTQKLSKTKNEVTQSNVCNVQDKFIELLNIYFREMCKEMVIRNARDGDIKSRLILEKKGIEW